MRLRPVCDWLGTGGLAAALACLSIGCGSESGIGRLIPVSGKVTYKGAPLTTGAVILVADAAKGNATKHEPRGPIDEEGNYQVSTAGSPGAPPGWYKVAVVTNKPANPKNPYAVTGSLLPKKYSSANTSELAIEVTENPGEGAYNLTLK